MRPRFTSRRQYLGSIPIALSTAGCLRLTENGDSTEMPTDGGETGQTTTRSADGTTTQGGFEATSWLSRTWTRDTYGQILGARDGGVIIAENDSLTTRNFRSGNSTWSIDIGDQLISEISVQGGVITALVYRDEGDVFARFDIDSGDRVWRYVPDDKWDVREYAVSEDHVVALVEVLGELPTVYCLSRTDGTVLWSKSYEHDLWDLSIHRDVVAVSYNFDEGFESGGLNAGSKTDLLDLTTGTRRTSVAGNYSHYRGNRLLDSTGLYDVEADTYRDLPGPGRVRREVYYDGSLFVLNDDVLACLDVESETLAWEFDEGMRVIAATDTLIWGVGMDDRLHGITWNGERVFSAPVGENRSLAAGEQYVAFRNHHEEWLACYEVRKTVS